VSPARFAAVERIADVAHGSDQQFDETLAILFGEAVAQNELVGPGDDIAGLVLPGRSSTKVHAQGVGSEVLVRELRAGFGHGAVFGVVNAWRGTGVLGIDAQAHVAVVIRLRLSDDLDGGFFFFGFFVT
jgi:hypothetical protein